MLARGTEAGVIALDATLSPLAFGVHYLPQTYTCAPAAMHRDIERTWLDRSQRLVAIVGPAGSAKSTVLRTCMLHDALFEPDFLCGVIVGPTDSLARVQLGNIARLLESDALAEFGTLRGGRWNTEAIEIAKPCRRGTTCLLSALSPDMDLKSMVHTTAGITQRPQVALADDAEGGEDGSEAEFRAFETFVVDTLYPRLDWTSPLARLVRAENLSHPRATIAQMFERYPYRDPIAREHYGDGDEAATAAFAEWRRYRYDCYLRDGCTSYWLERWPEAELERQKLRLAPYPGAWQRSFRTRPVLSGDPAFPDWLLADARCIGHAPTSRLEIPAGSYVVLAVDDAKETGARHDYTALAVTARQADGRVHVVDVDWRKIPLSEQEAVIVEWIRAWLPDAVLFEDKRLAQNVTVLARQSGHYPTIECVSRAGIKKHPRIVGMREHIERGTIVFPSGTFRSGRTSAEVRGRFRVYSRDVEHDDPEDAIETAVTRCLRHLRPAQAPQGDGTPVSRDAWLKRRELARERMFADRARRRRQGVRA